MRRLRTPARLYASGAPAPKALPSMPATAMELSSPPSPSAAAGTASGPAADSAAATVLMVGVAAAQLGGTVNFPTRVPRPQCGVIASGCIALNSVPWFQCGASPRPPPNASLGSGPSPGCGANLRSCEAGKLISRPMSLNPVVKFSGVLMALYSVK